MILYNVTINVEDQQHDEWLEWMLNIHIPKVMESGMFISYKMFRLISRQPGETGTTYSVQYSSESMEKFDIYREVYAPALQQQTLDKFGASNLPVAFRSVLEEV